MRILVSCAFRLDSQTVAGSVLSARLNTSLEGSNRHDNQATIPVKLSCCSAATWQAAKSASRAFGSLQSS